MAARGAGAVSVPVAAVKVTAAAAAPAPGDLANRSGLPVRLIAFALIGGRVSLPPTAGSTTPRCGLTMRNTSAGATLQVRWLALSAQMFGAPLNGATLPPPMASHQFATAPGSRGSPSASKAHIVTDVPLVKLASGS